MHAFATLTLWKVFPVTSCKSHRGWRKSLLQAFFPILSPEGYSAQAPTGFMKKQNEICEEGVGDVEDMAALN